MARTRAAATQLRAYPAFPAAPHNGAEEPGLTMAIFLSSPSSGSLPSVEAYLQVPGTNAQRLTSEAHMSDPLWREARPSRPYGSEPGARPRGPDPGIPAGGPRPPADGSRTPRRDPGRGDRDSRGPNPGGREPQRRDPGWDGRAPGLRGPGGNGRAHGMRRDTARGAGGARDAHRRRNPQRPGRWGSLQGGLGVCIIVASAAIGAVATMVTRSAPGFLLGLCVVAGTVAAALAVRPRAGRMIIPVPVLFYLVAALISGVVYNRSADSSRTALAIAAAQWIANGFFAMVLATVLRSEEHTSELQSHHELVCRILLEKKKTQQNARKKTTKQQTKKKTAHNRKEEKK